MSFLFILAMIPFAVVGAVMALITVCAIVGSVVAALTPRRWRV